MRRLLLVSLAASIAAASFPALSQTASISPHCQRMMMIGCALSKNSKGRNAPAAAKECAELLKQGECAPPMPAKIVKRDTPVPTDEAVEESRGEGAPAKAWPGKKYMLDDANKEAAPDDIAEEKEVSEEIREEKDAPEMKRDIKTEEKKPAAHADTAPPASPDEETMSHAADEELQQDDTVTVPPKDLINQSVASEEHPDTGYAPAAKTGPAVSSISAGAAPKTEPSRPAAKPDATAPGIAAADSGRMLSSVLPKTEPALDSPAKAAAETAPITVPEKENVNPAIAVAADPGSEPTPAEAAAIAPSKVVELAPAGTAPATAQTPPNVSLPAAIPSAPSVADAANIQADTSGPMTLTFGTGLVIPGEDNKVTFFLRRSDNNSPVTLQDLKEVHTQKLHLLIIDPSLKEYHHVHPTEGPQPGEYSFTFKPAGSYFRVFADVTTIGSDTNLFVPGVLGVKPVEKATIDTVTRYESSDGANVSAVLSFDAQPKAGNAVMGKIHLVDNTGTPVRNLEPVMGAFGHIVAFSQDLNHVLHVHPMGNQPHSANDMGGPDLEFHFEPHAAGFVRLFVQVKITGKDIFIPFGFTVQ